MKKAEIYRKIKYLSSKTELKCSYGKRFRLGTEDEDSYWEVTVTVRRGRRVYLKKTRFITPTGSDTRWWWGAGGVKSFHPPWKRKTGRALEKIVQVWAMFAHKTPESIDGCSAQAEYQIAHMMGDGKSRLVLLARDRNPRGYGLI